MGGVKGKEGEVHTFTKYSVNWQSNLWPWHGAVEPVSQFQETPPEPLSSSSQANTVYTSLTVLLSKRYYTIMRPRSRYSTSSATKYIACHFLHLQLWLVCCRYWYAGFHITCTQPFYLSPEGVRSVSWCIVHDSWSSGCVRVISRALGGFSKLN